MPQRDISITRSLAMNSSNSGAIVGIKGRLLGKIIRIKSGERISIGRDVSQCQLILSEDIISRVHCTIEYNAASNDYTVCDLSKNGVKVNGKYKLKKGAYVKLKPGSTLFMGDDTNQLRLG